MDKQIIINGIDVSGCDEYYADGLCLTGVDSTVCKDNPNCYYKQLKAKEQECERLKKEVEFYTTPVRLGDYKPITLIIEELDHLKIENEVLKEKLETVYDDCKGCSSWNEALYNANLYAKEYRKLKQALQEIKEIAEGMHDLWINKTPYTDIDNLVKHLLECELNRIRYKFDDISEVEDET